jgi:hypothetical protein
MIKAIGFKQLSVTDYNQCLVRLLHFSLIHGARASYVPFFRARARCARIDLVPDKHECPRLKAAPGSFCRDWRLPLVWVFRRS